MSDSPYLRDLLDDIRNRQAETLSEVKDVRSEVGEVRSEVGELRLEVRTSTASEADCAGRAEREARTRDDAIRRVWSDGINPLVERVGKLEAHHLTEEGAVTVKRGIGKWVAGVAAAALAAIFAWYLRGCAP